MTKYICLCNVVSKWAFTTDRFQLAWQTMQLVYTATVRGYSLMHRTFYPYDIVQITHQFFLLVREDFSQSQKACVTWLLDNFPHRLQALTNCLETKKPSIRTAL